VIKKENLVKKKMSHHGRSGLRRVEKIPEFGPAHFITTGTDENEFHVNEEVKNILDEELRFNYNNLFSVHKKLNLFTSENYQRVFVKHL
jgi:hypothetical protein